MTERLSLSLFLAIVCIPSFKLLDVSDSSLFHLKRLGVWFVLSRQDEVQNANCSNRYSQFLDVWYFTGLFLNPVIGCSSRRGDYPLGGISGTDSSHLMVPFARTIHGFPCWILYTQEQKSWRCLLLLNHLGLHVTTSLLFSFHWEKQPQWMKADKSDP